jgi:hypothetical protein
MVFSVRPSRENAALADWCEVENSALLATGRARAKSKAAEGRRTPRRFAHAGASERRASVLECASPLALSHREPSISQLSTNFNHEAQAERRPRNTDKYGFQQRRRASHTFGRFVAQSAPVPNPKRRRAAALQDASRTREPPSVAPASWRASSPLALSHRAPKPS